MKRFSLLVAPLSLIASTARDPFCWPTATLPTIEQRTITVADYVLIGISHNNDTDTYSALIRYKDTLLYITTNALLPDNVTVIGITASAVHLRTPHETLIIPWYPIQESI